MSDPKTSPGDIAKRRNLPSWMNSGGNKSDGANPIGSAKNQNARDPRSSSVKFSKLLEGVVFVLSGFVNPERATLRSQALEMGAEYRPDWGSDCTLLVCAYSNTPKFRQVEADCGTIVKKEWILECYSHKKLVDIDAYVMYAGKPWRKTNNAVGSSSGQRKSPQGKAAKQSEKKLHLKPRASSPSKSAASNASEELFFPSKVKEWAAEDLNRTISWLESQGEKPEPSEIKQIAAEGIITCLQDAIEFLEQNQDIRQIPEQWNIVPRAVEELVKLVNAENDSASLSKGDICRQAKEFKQMYEAELSSSLDDNSKTKKKRPQADNSGRNGNERTKGLSKGAAGYDSDETIEMTEEEIDRAYNSFASKIHD